MAQAIAACGSLIHICSLRVTRLDSQGNVLNEAHNSYVTNNVVSVQVNPVVENGLDSTQVGGCDCIIASYKGTDKLKRFEFQLELPTFEPGLIEMLTGSTLIVDESDDPVPIGVGFPKQLSCNDPQAPNVAIEWWSDLWTDDQQDPNWPYVHSVYPSSYWQIGQQNAQNDFANPQYNGFTRTNTLFANPYDDQPPSAEAALAAGCPGEEFLTTVAPPEGECGYQTVYPLS